jgi:quercetin dioxygenase-like cupin family protein
MLNRRRFAACAICSAVGLIASQVAADAQPTGGVSRTILQKTDYPGDRHATILVMAEIAPGALVARHTYPGVKSGYIVEGGGTLAVKGHANREIKAGDGFQIPPETPHSVQNGNARTRVLITYVVEKDKPLASPAPE